MGGINQYINVHTINKHTLMILRTVSNNININMIYCLFKTMWLNCHYEAILFHPLRLSGTMTTYQVFRLEHRLYNEINLFYTLCIRQLRHKDSDSRTPRDSLWRRQQQRHCFYFEVLTSYAKLTSYLMTFYNFSDVVTHTCARVYRSQQYINNKTRLVFMHTFNIYLWGNFIYICAGSITTNCRYI